MQDNPADKINELEELIRVGRGDLVRHELQKIDLKNLSIAYLPSYSNIARRVGQANLALKILNPVVKTAVKVTDLTPEARLAYGAAMIDIGAYQTGVDILITIDPNEYPQALLFQSFACFNQWQSAAAIPLLVKYVGSARLTEYELMIGRLNLTSAYVGEGQYDSAQEILKDLLPDAERSDRQLVLGSCYELLGQCYVFSGERKRAEDALNQAVEILKMSFILPALWARKWQAINQLLARKPEGHLQLEKVRAEAVEKHDFETVRECDLLLGKSDRDVELLNQIFFGTSYEGYRRRMKRILGEEVFGLITDSYVHRIGSEPYREVDLFTGTERGGLAQLRFGRQGHQLLFLLASDLYKPFKLGTLFAELFPDERFNPYSSPARIYQAITRFRSEVDQLELDFEINEVEGRFGLGGHSVALYYSKPIENVGFIDLHFEQIKVRFPSDEFTAKEVSDCFDLSVRSAQRKLQFYFDRGLLQRFGAGKNRRYWVAER